MQVKFIGNTKNPSDNRGYVDWAGERFHLNVPRELPEGPAFAKILKNGHFAVVDEVPAEIKSPEPASADEKAELIAFAEQHGVKIDKRWTAEKIAMAIEAVEVA